MRNDKKGLIGLLAVVLVILTTVAYSALATSLSITGEATFRAVSDIRVTNTRLKNATGATEQYTSRYTKDTITAGFTLNNSSSVISYDVTITNNGTIDQAIYNLTTISSNNNGLVITITYTDENNVTHTNVPINEALPIIVPFGTSKTITINYSSSTPGTVDVVNKFDFREVYYITYETRSSSSISPTVKYKNVDTTITNEEPELTGYDFLGWTDEQAGTTVKFTKGATYTLNEDKILYALYRKKGYVITFDTQDGREPTEKVVETGDQ